MNIDWASVKFPVLGKVLHIRLTPSSHKTEAGVEMEWEAMIFSI